MNLFDSFILVNFSCAICLNICCFVWLGLILLNFFLISFSYCCLIRLNLCSFICFNCNTLYWSCFINFNYLCLICLYQSSLVFLGEYSFICLSWSLCGWVVFYLFFRMKGRLRAWVDFRFSLILFTLRNICTRRNILSVAFLMSYRNIFLRSSFTICLLNSSHVNLTRYWYLSIIGLLVLRRLNWSFLFLSGVGLLFSLFV